MKKSSNRPFVATKGGKPSKSGVKGSSSESEFQKLLKGWPPKTTVSKKK